MAKRGKQHRNMVAQVDRTHAYGAVEGIELLQKVRYGKFNETVEVSINLGVNPRHADQMVRGAVVLPHGLGKEVKVLVFAKGEKETEAREAGADFVGGMEFVTRIQEGWLDFDKAIATPDMMGVVGRIARILGPRGMMPNPKVGTVTVDVEKAVKSAKSGEVQFKVEKSGVVQAGLGKVSFDKQKISENITAFIESVNKAKPAGAKGSYLKRISLSSTMGPSVTLDSSQFAS